MAAPRKTLTLERGSRALEYLQAYLRSVYSGVFRRRKLLRLEGPKYVLFGFNLRAVTALLRVLGLSAGAALGGQCVLALLRGSTPLRVLGAVEAPAQRRLLLIDKGKKKAFLLLDVDDATVVKAVAPGTRAKDFARELAALRQLTECNSRIAPRLVDWRDREASGLSWFRMTLHPNRRRVGERDWPRFRNGCLTGPLFESYRATGAGPRPLSGYLGELRAYAVAHTSEQIVGYLDRLATTLASRAGVEAMYTCLTHGEIRQGHVARNGKEWVLIDWGNAAERSPFYDLYTQELQVLRERLDAKTRAPFPASLIRQMFADPEDNPWSATRLDSPNPLDGFKSGWQHIFFQHLCAETGVPLSAAYVRLLIVVSELERLAGNIDHRRNGAVALYLLGAPIDISRWTVEG